MRIRVQCYSGYKADERPVRLYLGESSLEVKEVLDRWYGEDHDYFKVRADDQEVYLLRHSRADDTWELILQGGR
ncbi:MAG: hypothetical protein ACUVS3_13160 [Thermodesulfobacteriota bacterium]